MHTVVTAQPRVHDMRLALAAGCGWLVALCLVSLVSPETGRATALGLCAVFALITIVTLRKLPSAALVAVTCLAIVLSIALRNPMEVFSAGDSHLYSSTSVSAFVYPSWLQWLADMRQSFQEMVSGLPGLGAELLPGMAIGDVSQLSDTLKTAMKMSSMTHLTAVSGANCAIVVGAVTIVAAQWGAARWVRVISAIVVMLLFVLLVTPQASVVRAAVMASIVLMSSLGGKLASGLPMLACAVLGMLVIYPRWAVDFGFALSVMATAGLLLFAQPIALSLSRWMPRFLALVISVPLSAQLMCQPILVVLSPNWSTYGIAANVLASVAVPIVTILGLLACVISPVCVPVAVGLAWIAWLPASFIAYLAMTVSRLPFAQIAWAPGWIGFMLALCFSVLAVCMLISHSRAVRRLSAMVVISTALGVCSVAVVQSVQSYHAIPPNWLAVACDVGQGDALLVRSAGKTMLIDTGPRAPELRRCMSQAGVTKIDLLVLTHFDHDHVGGTDAVPGPVDQILVSSAETQGDEYFISSLRTLSQRVEIASKGMTGKLGEATWQVLWPSPTHPDMVTGNPGSTVMRVQVEGFTLLALADLEHDSQHAFVSDVGNKEMLSNIDVVKVAHHGSANQFEPLYRMCMGAIALVSVGKDNHYGHPTDQALAILSRSDDMIERTDVHGWIALYATGAPHQLKVITERS